jgi:hypothetical protein
MMFVPADQDSTGATPRADPLPAEQPAAPQASAPFWPSVPDSVSGITDQEMVSRTNLPVANAPAWMGAGQPTPTIDSSGEDRSTRAQPADSVWGDAFDLNNDVVNATKYLSRSAYPVDPSYDPGADPNFVGTRFEQYYSDRFAGSNSADETTSIIADINRENRDAQVTGGAGWKGVLANMAAGIASPFSLLPVGGLLHAGVEAGLGLRVALGMAETGALSAGAVGLQQSVLQATEQTHTYPETFWNMASAAVAGSVLGGAVSRR